MGIGKLEQLRRNVAAAEKVVADIEARINAHRIEGVGDETSMGPVRREAGRVEANRIREREIGGALQRVKVERGRLVLGQEQRDGQAKKLARIEAYPVGFGDTINETFGAIERLEEAVQGFPAAWGGKGFQEIKTVMRRCRAELSSRDSVRKSLASWDGDIPPEHDAAQGTDANRGDPIRLKSPSQPPVFVSEILDLGSGYHCTSGAFGAAYRRWCSGRGVKPLKGQALEDALKPFGITKGRFMVNGKRQRAWRGCMVKK